MPKTSNSALLLSLKINNKSSFCRNLQPYLNHITPFIGVACCVALLASILIVTQLNNFLVTSFIRTTL